MMGLMFSSWDSLSSGLERGEARQRRRVLMGISPVWTLMAVAEDWRGDEVVAGWWGLQV